MIELIVAAEAAASEGASLHPIAVGVITLVFLMAFLGGALAFGRGREHT